MKLKRIHIEHFKRFTDLTIRNLPDTARMVVLVGPNGCGKTSLFEAFNHWYRLRGFSTVGDKTYNVKKEQGVDLSIEDWYNRVSKVDIECYGKKMEESETIRGMFYFRSAFRHDPDFTIRNFSKQEDPLRELKNDLMSKDATVSANYQRLTSDIISGVFKGENDEKTIKVFREEIIGKLNESINHIFEDLVLTGIGEDPLSNGSFFFNKGTASAFHYKNLSSGEKAAFDLILDLLLKARFFPDAVYCIDEPEAHMHTHLQSVLLKELYNLIPEESQLWISTHSLGMLRRAQAIENDNPGSVVFLDFEGYDFDAQVTMEPSIIDRAILGRFMQLALDDLSDFVAPKTIIFCEGDPVGRKKPSFDANVYTTVFSKHLADVAFVSIGSSSDVKNEENKIIKVVSGLSKGSRFIKLVDRDSMCDEEIDQLRTRRIKTLRRRHIESYLFDDEIIVKLCEANNHPELVEECLGIKEKELLNVKRLGKMTDDIKSASGEIMLGLKRRLNISRGGNDIYNFCLYTMAPLITPDTKVYQELEEDIFH